MRPVYRKRTDPHPRGDGPPVECWVCVACGTAYPFDHKELVLGAGAGGTGNFHWHPSGGNGQVVRVGKMFPKAAAELCGPRYPRTK